MNPPILWVLVADATAQRIAGIMNLCVIVGLGVPIAKGAQIRRGGFGGVDGVARHVDVAVQEKLPFVTKC
jgi:hypothetical protein